MIEDIITSHIHATFIVADKKKQNIVPRTAILSVQELHRRPHSPLPAVFDHPQSQSSGSFFHENTPTFSFDMRIHLHCLPFREGFVRAVVRLSSIARSRVRPRLNYRVLWVSDEFHSSPCDRRREAVRRDCRCWPARVSALAPR